MAWIDRLAFLGRLGCVDCLRWPGGIGWVGRGKMLKPTCPKIDTGGKNGKTDKRYIGKIGKRGKIGKMVKPVGAGKWQTC